MRRGAAISGSVHAALLALAIFGADLFADSDTRPFVLTEIDLIDGSDFDAAVSTAPVVPNEGPAELSQPSEEQGVPGDVSRPVETATAPEPLPRTNPTDPQPDRPEVAVPPPPREIPTEAPAPSIAEIPSPDPLQNQAAEPESPVSTEPVQPIASAPPVPQTKPSPPPVQEPPVETKPEPEPVVAETPEPAEVEPKPEPEQPAKPEPEAVVEAQPEAPEGAAPREARLPIAKPADLAAAARAASATEQPEQQAAKPAEEPAQAKPATAPSGGSSARFANAVSRGEKDALRLGIKRYFTYNGNRADPTLAVVIEIQLDQSGRMTGSPRQIGAQGGDAGAQRALFQAGRRALIQAETAGVFGKLPAAKYEGWRLIHVTFTPEEIGFST